MQYLSEGSLLQGGKYRIIRQLGQGGFGITYEGIQTGLERRVAVKEFFMRDYCNRDGQTGAVSIGSEGSRDAVEEYRQKFLKEARLIASLEGIPYMIHIYDVFEENATAYYVMEFVGGGSLKQQGRISEERALRYISQVGQALVKLHDRNILHLDIKPDNILLNGSDEAVLIDFGVSKHYDAKGGQTSSTPLGLSKGFAPNEQYQQGALDSFSPATDVYSLAATLYFMLTGQVPPEANLVLEDGLPKCPAHITPTVWEAIEKAMKPSRKQRTQTVQAFLQQLGQSDNCHATVKNETQTRLAATDTSGATIIASSHKKRAPWVVLAVVLALTVGTGLWMLTQDKERNVDDGDEEIEETAIEGVYELTDGYHCYDGTWDSDGSAQPCRIEFRKDGKRIYNAVYTNLKWDVAVPMEGKLNGRTLELTGWNGSGQLDIFLELPTQPHRQFYGKGYDTAHETTWRKLTLQEK